MGTFLHIGICTKIDIVESQIKKIENNYDKFDDFIEDFQKQTNLKLSLYNLHIVEGNYLYRIKDELLESKELNAFLKDFYGFIYKKDKERLKIYCDDIYEDIKKQNSAKEIIELAEQKLYENFQISYSKNYIDIPKFDDINVNYEFITLFLNGKAYLEIYGGLFDYIERLMREESKHIHIDTVKIFLY